MYKMNELSFTYYGEIRGKGRPRFTNINGFMKAYTDANTRNYEMSLKEAFLQSVKDLPEEERIFKNGEALRLTLTIYQQVPKSISKKKTEQMLSGDIRPTKKPDVDNILKSVCDSLNKVAWLDDTQVVEVFSIKKYAETSYMKVRIQTIDYLNSREYFEKLLTSDEYE